MQQPPTGRLARVKGHLAAALDTRCDVMGGLGEFDGLLEAPQMNGLVVARLDVSPRCLMLSGSQDSMRGARWLAADPHSDGSGIFAVNTIDVIGSRQPGSGETLGLLAARRGDR